MTDGSPASTLLVRHAMPHVQPGISSRAWHLGVEGRASAHLLTPLLPPGALLVASSEPKASETVELAGAVTVDARFDEVRRDEPYDDAFRARRRAYVAGTDHPGWEDRTDVVARIDAALAEHRVAAGDRPLVVAGHGMAWTLWLTSALGLSDPGAFWADLRFPDAWVVDTTAGTLCRLDGW